MAYHQGTRQIHRLEPAASKVFSLCDGKTLRSEAANIAFPEEIPTRPPGGPPAPDGGKGYRVRPSLFQAADATSSKGREPSRSLGSAVTTFLMTPTAFRRAIPSDHPDPGDYDRAAAHDSRTRPRLPRLRQRRRPEQPSVRDLVSPGRPARPDHVSARPHCVIAPAGRQPGGRGIMSDAQDVFAETHLLRRAISDLSRGKFT